LRYSQNQFSGIISVILVISIMLGACTDQSGTSRSAPHSLHDDTQKVLVTEGRLTIGFGYSLPPLVFWQDDIPSGFEYELLLSISNRLDLQLVCTGPLNQGDLESSVQKGQLDAAASIYWNNDYDGNKYSVIDLVFASSTNFDDALNSIVNSDKPFLVPYINLDLVCLASSHSQINNLSDLNGKVVGAMGGASAQSWLSNQHGITVKHFISSNECLSALQTGIIDALLIEAVSIDKDFNRNHPDIRIVSFISTGEQLSLCISKDNAALVQAVLKAIHGLVKDGTYAAIFSNYFDYALNNTQ